MLTPEYLRECPDKLVKLWQQLEDWAIRDIAYRIIEAELYDYKGMPGTARYRAWVLKEAQKHQNEMLAQISVLTLKSDEELRELFQKASLLSAENEKSIYKAHGISPVDVRKAPYLKQILQAAYNQTNGEIHNFTRSTANATQTWFIDTMDRAYMEITTGMRSPGESIREALEDCSKNAVNVVYPSGHIDTIETAVRRAVMTGINQGTAKISLENVKRLGAEYIIIDSHLGARVAKDKIGNHAGWQGKIFKVEGEDEYAPNLEEETGFPTNPRGLCGYNCRHHFYPHFKGDRNPFKQYDSEENRKQYELSQKQRQMERKIRNSKKKVAALEAGIEHCENDSIKEQLNKEYSDAVAKLKDRNAVYKVFCKENHLTVEQERLRNMSYDGVRKNKLANPSARAAIRNTRAKVTYNDNYDYSIHLDDYNDAVNQGLSTAAKSVAKLGSETGYEHLYLVDLKTGELCYYETNHDASSVGYNMFRNYLSKKENKDKAYAFVHNHNTDGYFSEQDIMTLFSTKELPVMIAVRNDGVKYIAIRDGDIIETAYYDNLFANELKELNQQLKDGKITISERSLRREEIIVEGMLNKFTKRGLIEIDGRVI